MAEISRNRKELRKLKQRVRELEIKVEQLEKRTDQNTAVEIGTWIVAFLELVTAIIALVAALAG